MKRLLLIWVTLISFLANSQTAGTYTFATSTGGTAINPTYTTVQATSATCDDGSVGPTNIGFNFVYEGTTYTQFSANYNGVVKLGGTSIANATSGLTGNGPIIAAGFNDISAGWTSTSTASNAGYIRYGTSGTTPNRIFVIDFNIRNSLLCSSARNTRFQVRLYETSNKIEILFVTTSAATTNTWSTIFTTIGIGGASSANYLSVNGSNTSSNSTVAITPNWPGNGRMYTFTPPATCNAPMALTSSSVAATTATISWTAASPAPSSGYQYFLSTSSTAPTAGTTPTGSTAAGTVSVNLTGLSSSTLYYFWVRSNCGGSTSSWAGSSTFTTRPVNDACSGATSLPCATSNLAGSTVGAVSETAPNASTTGTMGVWYTFTGNGQQTTITVVQTLDTRLLVMTSSTSACGGTYTTVASDEELIGTNEVVTFNTVNGTNYFVYVGYYTSGSTTGTFTISRTCTPVPTNNNCAGAPALTVNSNTTCTTSSNGTTLGANQSVAACTGTADDDVWYTFVAGATSQIITVTPGTMTDAVFQVFSGSCAGLVSLACIDGTSGSSVETSTVSGLTVGTTYFVRVHSFGNGTGQGTFSICVTTPCLITTTPGTLTVSPSSGTVNDAFTYTTTGNAGSITSLEYSYDNFATVAGSFTNPANPFDLILNSYQSQVWVRTTSVNGTCPAGTTTPVSVTLQLAPPYTLGTSSGDYITNVTLNNLNNNSTYDLPLGDSYQNFTSLVANVTRGATYTLSVTATVTAGVYSGYAAWIDYNNNGTFEVSENVMQVSPLGLTQSVSITIPATAYVGTVKMRVLTRRNSAPTTDAYYSIGYNRGEIEEYSVNIQSALPVELSAFNGISVGKNNYLYWITASEHNTSHFNLQHSRDGETWTTITTLGAAGNSTNTIDYNVTDYNVEPIVNYYRLQQYDLNGVYETFGPIAINNTDSSTSKYVVKFINLRGQEIDPTALPATGVYIEVYSDGSMKKVYR